MYYWPSGHMSLLVDMKTPLRVDSIEEFFWPTSIRNVDSVLIMGP